MENAFVRRFKKARITLALLLLAALTAMALTDNFDGFLSGLMGGLLVSLLIGEIAYYYKRKRSRQRPD